MPGLFITFEGGEGTGKSTQVKRLAEHFRSQGRVVVETREPGGTAAGEALRNLLVTGEVGRWSAEAEAMLNAAARNVHVRDVIAPALARGDVIISDRFIDSTRAYQGHAGGCSFDLIDSLETAAIGDCRPNLTLMLDLDPALGLARAKARGEGMEDRYERKGLAFHEKLRVGFLAIARDEPQRCKVIDASQSIDKVQSDILQAVVAFSHG
jgi:dTMP kinase